ncbi:MAG: sigma-54-dependent Fis family transcriptional regulator [Chitinophagaceae bacterium]|nr:sigma-54-dependent Fis family transcriptional regulator [Chitinophagaceae bacterium]
MKRILIIDDDMDMCSLLSRFLQRKGYETDVAHSGAKGIAKVKEVQFDVVLCDFRLGDKEGREVLHEIKTIHPHLIVIIITGYSDIKTAVDVIKQGAFDYITKPLIPDEVLNVISKALNQPLDKSFPAGTSSEVFPVTKKRASVSVGADSDFLVGNSPATRDLYKQIELVAPTPYSVILYGESGTGKEVVAKTIHSSSDRKDKPFVAMDCGTLSKELSGSELFGHVKGSFTGALNDKEGHFELANGGTLFLDEVANLSSEIQASLLRVIQERKFKRVGGTKEMNVDVRIIVASNENLQDAYRKGKFREDLYHRFNEFSINIPPLRIRREDIPLFAEFFLSKACSELNKTIQGFDKEVVELFMDYAWPGNLREFRNVIRRAALLTNGSLVDASTLPWEITNRSSYPPMEQQQHHNAAPTPMTHTSLDLKNAATQAEYETIMNVLKQVNFNKTKAAELLKIDRKTLYNKLRTHESQNEFEE